MCYITLFFYRFELHRRLHIRKRINNRSEVCIAEMDESIYIYGIFDVAKICVTYADKRPIDAIDNGAKVSIALMHKAIVIYRSDDES